MITHGITIFITKSLIRNSAFSGLIKTPMWIGQFTKRLASSLDTWNVFKKIQIQDKANKDYSIISKLPDVSTKHYNSLSEKSTSNLSCIC